MTENIIRFLKSKQKKIKNLNHPPPIIMLWMKSLNMNNVLEIIDKHIAYLLNNGGSKKLEQWLLAGDINFNTITAERYIIRYLQQRNNNLTDNLGTDGIDAHIAHSNSDIGIEITTLNGDVASWILTERLTKILDEKNFLKDKSLEITYSQQKVSDATKGGTINNYINEISKAIISNDGQAISRFGFSINHHDTPPGWISWKVSDSDSFPWFHVITDDLFSKLQAKEKREQLKKFSRNLIFVGLNHTSTNNWAFPSIFRDLGNGEIHYRSEIQEIREYWLSQMPNLTNVIGICYFFYSLDSEVPFYPLKIFWRSEEDKVNINL